MGAAYSGVGVEQYRTINRVLRHYAYKTTSITHISIWQINGKLFVLLGETHENMDYSNLEGLLKFVDDMCETNEKAADAIKKEPIDYFIESPWGMHEREFKWFRYESGKQYRKRAKYIKSKQLSPTTYKRRLTRRILSGKQTGGLPEMRFQMTRQCHNYNVHYTDTRGDGLSNFLYFDRGENPYDKLVALADQLEEKLPEEAKIIKDSLVQTGNAWYDSVLHTYDLVERMTHSELKQAMHGYSKGVFYRAGKTVSEDQKDLTNVILDDVRKKLVNAQNTFTYNGLEEIHDLECEIQDIYTLARMVNRNNSNICIFFGGAKHTHTMDKWITKYFPGNDSYDSKDPKKWMLHTWDQDLEEVDFPITESGGLHTMQGLKTPPAGPDRPPHHALIKEMSSSSGVSTEIDPDEQSLWRELSYELEEKKRDSPKWDIT